MQSGDTSRHWVFVPYECYYHMYDKADLYRCAESNDIDWIVAMGDSQEREFVGMMKNYNGSQLPATKFASVSSD
jgi:hypothetical protein